MSDTGTWYVEALARREDETVAVARAATYSEAAGAEYFEIRSTSTLLRRLSDATGGDYFVDGETAGLRDRLRFASAGITEIREQMLWDAPAAFLLLLLLKIAEWLFRRRWSSI